MLVRTPLRIKILRMVNFTIPITSDTGCVIATCHTPWARLLAQCCLEKDYALVIGGDKWIRRIRLIYNQGRGFHELRHLVRHLRSGGRVIIIADVFKKTNSFSNCSAKFLEKDYNVSLLPVRLARIAGVPLMAVLPEFRNGTIHILEGPRFDLKILNSYSCEVMQNLLAFFEKEIKRDPSIWSPFIRESLSKG